MMIKDALNKDSGKQVLTLVKFGEKQHMDSLREKSTSFMSSITIYFSLVSSNGK